MRNDLQIIIESLQSYSDRDSGSPSFKIKVAELVAFAKRQQAELESMKLNLIEANRNLDNCKFPDGVPDHVYYSQVRRTWLQMYEVNNSDE